MKLKHLLAIAGLVTAMGISTGASAWFGPFGNNNGWGGNNWGGSPWNNGGWGGNNWNRGGSWNNRGWGGNNWNRGGPWGNTPWNGSPWSNSPMGNMSGPWDSGPWNNNWGGGPWNNNNDFFGSGPGSWMDPSDPKGSMSLIWDDMLNAPNEMGEMPGGWTAPSISVPNPVDVGDEFEDAARDAPGEAAEQMDNFRFN